MTTVIKNGTIVTADLSYAAALLTHAVVETARVVE